MCTLLTTEPFKTTDVPYIKTWVTADSHRHYCTYLHLRNAIKEKCSSSAFVLQIELLLASVWEEMRRRQIEPHLATETNKTTSFSQLHSPSKHPIATPRKGQQNVLVSHLTGRCREIIETTYASDVPDSFFCWTGALQGAIQCEELTC